MLNIQSVNLQRAYRICQYHETGGFFFPFIIICPHRSAMFLVRSRIYSIEITSHSFKISLFKYLVLMHRRFLVRYSIFHSASDEFVSESAKYDSILQFTGWF